MTRMMRLRTVAGGLVVALCAFGALAGSAGATKKPPMVFGEFEANVAGGLAPSPADPGVLKVEKEEEPELTGLQLGNFRFGVVEASTGLPEYEEPCEKLLKVTGKVEAEKSSSLEVELHFGRCMTSLPHNGATETATTNFTLAVKLLADHAGEVLEIVQPTKGVIRTAQRKCPIVIPRQTIPAKVNSEKEYEGIVSYTPESKPVENWETSRRMKEIYPSGEKQRLGIELGDKFKGIHSYVESGKGCVPAKGEENVKVVTEEGPYKGWLEYTNGYIFANIEGLEINKGELTFLPPAS